MNSTTQPLSARQAFVYFMAAAAALPSAAHAQLDVSAVYRQLSASICGGSHVTVGGSGDRPGYMLVDQGAALSRELSAECNGLNVSAVAHQSAVVSAQGIAVSSQYEVAFSGAPRNPYPAGQTPTEQDLMLAPSRAVTGRGSGHVHVDFSLSERTEFRVTGSTSSVVAASLFDSQDNEYLKEFVFFRPGWSANGVSLILEPGQYTFDLIGGKGLSLGYFEGFSGASSASTSFQFSMQAVPVPEPGTWALMGVGLVGLTVVRCRRLAT